MAELRGEWNLTVSDVLVFDSLQQSGFDVLLFKYMPETQEFVRTDYTEFKAKSTFQLGKGGGPNYYTLRENKT